ncbi:D(2) dopamine receptor-like [Actinia tenebrosa]|uniref:D(2) dopamine receptor-like n=1 Tax=Actinia tenebrosa TaxID=6105 RepID=A0A6P8IX24_ACTTE|nr:D(2) dopamine receptor-like [Actinia tenebrosa]
MSLPTSPQTTAVVLPSNFTNETANGLDSKCSRDGYGALHYTMAALILVLALAGNGFICVAFATRRKLRTVTNYFVVNLAVASFLLVIQWVVWIGLYLLCIDIAPVVKLAHILEILFGSASVVSLGVVSYDRYYAVTRALHYGSTMTHRRALTVIIAVWVYATITASLLLGTLDKTIGQLYMKIYISALFLFNFFIPFVISAYCYVRIFLIAMLHLQHGAPANQLSDPLSKASTLRKQLKISLNIFILAVPFLFIWNFFYAITVYEVMCYDCRVVESPTAEYFVSNLPEIIAAINPLIFICLTKNLRNFLIMGLRCSKDHHRRRANQFAQSESYPATTQFTTNYQGGNGYDAIAKV